MLTISQIGATVIPKNIEDITMTDLTDTTQTGASIPDDSRERHYCVQLPNTITEGIAFAPAAGRSLWTVLALHGPCGEWHKHYCAWLPVEGLKRRAPCGRGWYVLRPLIVNDADAPGHEDDAEDGPQ